MFHSHRLIDSCHGWRVVFGEWLSSSNIAENSHNWLSETITCLPISDLHAVMCTTPAPSLSGWTRPRLYRNARDANAVSKCPFVKSATRQEQTGALSKYAGSVPIAVITTKQASNSSIRPGRREAAGGHWSSCCDLCHPAVGTSTNEI